MAGYVVGERRNVARPPPTPVLNSPPPLPLLETLGPRREPHLGNGRLLPAVVLASHETKENVTDRQRGGAPKCLGND